MHLLKRKNQKKRREKGKKENLKKVLKQKLMKRSLRKKRKNRRLVKEEDVEEMITKAVAQTEAFAKMMMKKVIAETKKVTQAFAEAKKVKEEVAEAEVVKEVVAEAEVELSARKKVKKRKKTRRKMILQSNLKVEVRRMIKLTHLFKNCPSFQKSRKLHRLLNLLKIKLKKWLKLKINKKKKIISK